MRSGWIMAIVLLLALQIALAVEMAGFTYVMDQQISPEGNPVPFGAQELINGRTHNNGMAVVSQFGHPNFQGPYSQSETPVVNLSEGEYPQVFQGGWAIPHDPLILEFSQTVASIREHCLPAHYWPAMLDSFLLTTLIRFDGQVYHAAQYAESQITGADTLWQMPWTTQSLPGAAELQVIWVEGVARIKGMVSGKVTLLASDSLFIMGDLVTEDVILDPCGSDPPNAGAMFGLVPAGSPNRIGLIGEKDVILAATLENGFANGLSEPNQTCGLFSEPVVTTCGQGRRDVIITAAVLALGCSFEAEFWKTTAWGATVPPPTIQSDPCPGLANTHVTIWDNTGTIPGLPDCISAQQFDDRRGTLWFCGSMAMMRRGYLIRNSPGPWGQAWIGYQYRAFRFDGNLLASPPPFWPEVEWADASQVEITLSTGTEGTCGAVADPAGFAEEWIQGQVQVNLVAHYEPEFPEEARPENVLILTRINGVVLDSVWTTITWETPAFQWTSSRDLTPWLEQDVALRLEVQRGAWFTLPDNSGFFEPLFYWNANGEECSWSWNAVAVDEPAIKPVFSLSNPWPNPFNPVTQVELTLPQTSDVTLEVHDLLGRREALLHGGMLPAGTRTFTIDGSGWAAGLHLLTLRHAGGVETRKLLLLK